MKYPSLPHMNSFGLKHIGSGIRLTTAVCSLDLLAYNTFVQICSLKMYFVFDDDACFLEAVKGCILFTNPKFCLCLIIE